VSFLLDTNVVSEWVKPRPHERVVRWLTEVDEDSVYLSVITFLEIRQGIEEMAAGRRRDTLALWIESELPRRFDQRIIGVDLTIADEAGVLLARSRKTGANLSVPDALFAATGSASGLTLVTRNTRHFQKLGLPLLNPWMGSLTAC